MKKILTSVFLICAVLSGTAAEQVNLVPVGNFEAEYAVIRKQIRSTGDGWKLFKERPGDNTCAKLEIKKIYKNKDATLSTASTLNFTVKGLKPRTVYRVRFDLSGTAPSFLFLCREKASGNLKYNMITQKKKQGSYIPTPVDWRENIAEFTTKKGGECTFTISLWHNTRYGRMFYSPGDYVLIDNIAVYKK